MKNLGKFLTTPIGLILSQVPAVLWTYYMLGFEVAALYVFVVILGIGVFDFIASKFDRTLSEAIADVMHTRTGKFFIWALVFVPYLLVILYVHFWYIS